MNPLLIIALVAAGLGLAIEIYEKQKEKQATPEGDVPPVEEPAAEVIPDAETNSDNGAGKSGNGSDSGTDITPSPAEPAGKPSINLDNQ